MTYYQQPPARPKRRAPLLVLLVVALFGTLGCIGVFTLVSMSNDADARNSLAPIVVPTDNPSPTPGPPETPKAVAERSWNDGTYAVPGEIQAGTYVTRGNDVGCYWARLKGFDGDLESIIASGLLSEHAKGRITIKKSDKGAEFSGGCIWTRVE